MRALMILLATTILAPAQTGQPLRQGRRILNAICERGLGR
jgi:hypothetical protein